MTQLKIRELNPYLGAEIEGFDPRAKIDDATWHVLSRTFDDRGVLVFRNIDLDVAMQHHVVEVLYAGGDLKRVDYEDRKLFSTVSNTEPDGGSPYGRLLFHTDMMWADPDIANQVPSLYALEAQQPSTPTIFASTTHAWKTLPEALRMRVKGLHARHQSGPQGRGNSPYEHELIQPKWDKLNDTTTPIALPHPRTGAMMLYVGDQHTREIVELPKDESDALLDALYAHLYKPEVLLEHHWRTGDFVIWDNLAVQHARPYVSKDGPARTLRKIHAPSAQITMKKFGGGPTYAKAM
jgi:taurine dioxygenase